MADVHDKVTRSYNMSRIRSKDTKPEIIVRKHLHSLGFRFSLNRKSLPGKPDIYLRKYNTVIQIHGYFWHGHEGCKYFVFPKTRSSRWKEKIERNIENDNKKAAELKKLKLNVIVIWECDLKREKMEKTMSRLIKNIKLQG
jgi:DNA mismatch endonuclease (patch repair protein)